MKQWIDTNLIENLMQKKDIISMNSNSSLLFLARLTCLIETVVDFPIQTPLEFCIVNGFTIRRPESISWLDLIKMSIREPIFSLPIQQTDKAQCPLAIYPFLFIFKTPSGFLAPHFSKMLSSGMNQWLVIEIH